MFLQGIESSSMIAMNQKRLTGLNLNDTYEKLATGQRINKSGDDPSGLAVGSGMKAQLRGIMTAIGNIQEGILLLHTADSALNQVHDILMREREISVRGANEAVQYTVTNANPNDISPSSERTLFNELDTWELELYQMTTRDNFNTKSVMFGYQTGQALQIGPDNDPSHRTQIVIPDIGIMGRMNPTFMPGDITHEQFVAAFQNQIDTCDADIATVSDARAQVAAQENNLNHTLNELTTQYHNISGAKSSIMDADMASEMVQFTKYQILDSAVNTALAQANTEKGIIKQFCDAVGLDASQRVNQQ
ncbi:MAG: flagellin [Victivallales bacterium]